MQTQESKVGLAVIITALVVGGGVYYFTAEKTTAQPIASTKVDTASYTSKEYAVMGRELHSALQCASWASITKDDAESERLFTFGYEQGQKFLAAIKAEKVKKEDISSEVPIAVAWMLQGPTEEFILGRIYEAAQEDALEEVFKTGDEFNSDEMQKIIAGNKYRDGNCQLIGK